MTSDGLGAVSQAPSNQFRSSPFVPRLVEVSTKGSSAGLANLIGAQDLSVVFQPIVYADTGAVFAYEALVRCRLPRYHDPPELFRRAVEERCTGRLGRQIREIAFGLVGEAPLFVNVHPSELEERWLVQADDPIFFHAPPLYLEVTEALPLSHARLCHDVLNDLRARANIHVVVDDLGAGYSNLKHIADLGPAVVKLDRGLVEGIDKNERQRTLVTGIVRLCQDLGAEVLAEGVETAAEYRALLPTGVRYIQGFLFARPAFPLPPVTPIDELR
jgi:EAL domain-containing protein (putative c-di-GMP-specific phosphodiesterase class I)